MFEIPCILSLLACCFNSPHPAAATVLKRSIECVPAQMPMTSSSSISPNKFHILSSSHVTPPSTALWKCLYQC
ncbi:hypothetical protein B0H13DRAFT_2084536 [Mycena leptocephala]|nr:hypothetical protein B0H13DRAFT_2084536 [Mycena leptocephala]